MYHRTVLASEPELDALQHLFGGHAFAGQQAADALHQRLHMRSQQGTGIQVRQQFMHGQQCLHLLRRKPQPRQLSPVTRMLMPDGVAAGHAVELHRHIELIAHVGQVALEGGGRHLQALQHVGKRDRRAGVQQPLLDAVDAGGLGHGLRGFKWRCPKAVSR